MSSTYTDLVNQTFDFPQDGFVVKDNYLQFNGVDLKKLIDKYGTPFKLTFLPKIGMQINRAKKMFNDAIRKQKYDGEYFYCYCTKSSHFSFTTLKLSEICISEKKSPRILLSFVMDLKQRLIPEILHS
jgi:arginine decarboxylase